MNVAPALLLLLACGDWTQFMHDASHTGDAADESLAFPLGLVAQLKLGDAVMTSPISSRAPPPEYAIGLRRRSRS